MLLVHLILKLKFKYAVQKHIRGERTGYYPEIWTQFKCLQNFYLKLLFVKLLKKLFERKSALSNHWQFFFFLKVLQRARSILYSAFKWNTHSHLQAPLLAGSYLVACKMLQVAICVPSPQNCWPLRDPSNDR